MPEPPLDARPTAVVAVAVTILRMVDDALQILLIQKQNPPYAGAWALPGGPVAIDESLKHAAWRELKDETGLRAAHLEQVYAFGHPRRDPRGRVVTIAYLALLPPGALTQNSGAEWFDVNALPDLALDHPKIVARSLHRLSEKTDDLAVALELLPETFTLPELRRAIELIRGEPLDRRNFRKRVLRQGLILATGEVARRGAHRPAKLYRAAPAVAA